MKDTRILMGMPITVEVVDNKVKKKDLDDVYKYFNYVDEKFSTYKRNSEIMKINRGEIKQSNYSADMKKVLSLCKKTNLQTNGFFDITHNGQMNPSGLVKGWSIYNAALLLKKKGYENFYIDAGGDIQTFGKNSKRKKWVVGIRNPFNRRENVKVVTLEGQGVATSGTAIRGEHIYDPHYAKKRKSKIISLTVIGPNIYDADRFATAAFAMGAKGISFVESLGGFEGYMIDKTGIATYTSGFEKYVLTK